MGVAGRVLRGLCRFGRIRRHFTDEKVFKSNLLSYEMKAGKKEMCSTTLGKQREIGGNKKPPNMSCFVEGTT